MKEEKIIKKINKIHEEMKEKAREVEWKFEKFVFLCKVIDQEFNPIRRFILKVYRRILLIKNGIWIVRG